MNRIAPRLLIAEILLMRMWLSGTCIVAGFPARA
jgi:hypothetical protein